MCKQDNRMIKPLLWDFGALLSLEEFQNAVDRIATNIIPFGNYISTAINIISSITSAPTAAYIFEHHTLSSIRLSA